MAIRLGNTSRQPAPSTPESSPGPIVSQLNLHISNRLDLLAAALGQEVAARPLPSAFTPEIVVVQSAAARRWLTLRLAELHGVCANFEFPFLGAIVARLIAAGPEGAALDERPSADVLTWRIESALRRCTGRPEFAAVAIYLAGGDSLKRFALAARLAALFDQYRLYRPELLLQWATRGPGSGHADEIWQARLWLEVDGTSDFDRALANRRTRGFSPSAQQDLPERLSVFAPTALAPAYLDLLFQLGTSREVHLFLLQPSPLYHGDDLTPKARARLGLREDEFSNELGHPLLASWGGGAAELTDLVLETQERLQTAALAASEQFIDVAPKNLLTTLQHRLFLDSATDSEASQTHPAIEAHDHSLVLNACHSPMREVEVLYDHLLDCFARDPALRPRDILVMTPEIEKYAPLIRAVFEYPEQEALRIPYTIADRHPRSESVPIDMFLTLLKLAGSRYTAPDIFLLLGSSILRRRFGLTDDDLSVIRAWIEETAIRWGIDADHRAAAGVPPLRANTWRQGLERLLLGFAMEGHGRDLFEGILPQDDVEGDSVETLGRLLAATDALFSIEVNFAASRPLGDWAEPLLQLITQFFEPSPGPEADDVRYLRAIVAHLATLAEDAAAPEAVEFPLVRKFLEDQVSALEQRGSVLGGGVTFSALKPVRSIPAKIVCVLGLNAQVFPRRSHPAQFDLMAERRRGDPHPGADDRLAFLETVLCARHQLSLSYVGRSVQDNKPVPPSAVVSELCDYLNEACQFPGGQSAEKFLLVEHPLHAFSPRYFTTVPGAQRLFDFAAPARENRLFSYSRANAEASRGIQAGPATVSRPFVESPLPETAAEGKVIELRELIYFWGNPAKYFIRQQLGFKLGDTAQCLAADESFALDQREKYPLKQELLAATLGFAPGVSALAFAARNILAPGAMGDLQYRSLEAEVEQFARVVRGHLTLAEKQPPRDVKLLLGEFTLGGRLNSVYGPGGLHFRCAQLKPNDRLRAWIEHLALCASGTGEGCQTILIGTDAIVSFDYVADAVSQLETLCRGYAAGARRPLPFFAASAFAYAAAEQEPDQDPLREARKKWEGGWHVPAESEDAYITRCFGDGAALPEEFISLAREICGPLTAHATMSPL
jgi:exodeoxyribonuclease V gamma subunit